MSMNRLSPRPRNRQIPMSIATRVPRSNRVSPWESPGEWLVSFRPCGLSGDEAADFPIRLIRIENVDPLSLRWVLVTCGDEPIFEVDSVISGGLYLSTAGEILLALGRISALEGLSIDVSSKPCCATDLEVSLRLRLPDIAGETDPRIRLEGR